MNQFYQKTKYHSMHLKGGDTFEGKSLENELDIAMMEKRPIEKNALQAVFYTQRKAGVLPETDIRTDRWELAQKAMNKINDTNKQNIIKLHQDTEVTDETSNEA